MSPNPPGVPDTAADAPPRDLLTAVREAWAAALGHRDFADDTDYFLVRGSHSVLVARIMADLCRVVGRRVSLRLFFDHATVRDLAAALARLDGVPGPVEEAELP